LASSLSSISKTRKPGWSVLLDSMRDSLIVGPGDRLE
jgi:hypothetical protein